MPVEEPVRKEPEEEIPLDEEKEERVLMDIKPSRKRFLKEYLAAALWICIALAMYYTPLSLPLEGFLSKPQLFGVAFFLSAAFLFITYAEARRYSEDYKITEDEVREDIGVFSDRITSLPYMKLERCGIERPFIEKIEGIGDVRVDAGRDFFILKGVSNPEEIRDLIEKRMREVTKDGNFAAIND